MEQRFEHKRRACYYTEIPDVLQKMEIDDAIRFAIGYYAVNLI